jgi:hypothetical protein
MESYVNYLLGMQQQLRVFHWQTKSYSRHKAFGEAYEDLSDLIDSFVEVHMGKYGRFVLTDKTIEVSNLVEVSVKDFIVDSCNYLIGLTGQLSPEKDTDLLNIRDEMLQVFNKLKYLLTLE